MPIAPARIDAFTVTTALGAGCDAHVDALAAMRPGLCRRILTDVPAPSWLGVIDALDEHPLDGDLAVFDCRNNRLVGLALDADGFGDAVRRAAEHHGPARIGLFIGTSTSGIRHTEHCYRDHFEQGTPGLGDDLRFDTTHAYASAAVFCRRRLGLAGPALVISTACSSGAKAFAAAHRALATGVCDAAVAGGVDTLCATTLMGFESLGLLSPNPCSPWDQRRSGISIGEGAAFALMDLAEMDDGGPALLGYGESSDAYHITRPHPDGLGAVLAMQWALDSAGLDPTGIDYINLHGTGTPANDESEDRAVVQVFGSSVPASATKGWTGHTLGASGAVEAVLSLLCVASDLLPGTLNTQTPDQALSTRLVLRSERRPIRRVLSNAFGFGGNNCTLVLGRP